MIGVKCRTKMYNNLLNQHSAVVSVFDIYAVGEPYMLLKRYN